MVARHAWILNFDADDELASPIGYTPSRAVAARAADLASRVGPLLGPEDRAIDPEHVVPGSAAGLAGRAWCPTPRALRALGRAGAILPAAPELAVLRRVNQRRFCAELGPTLPGAEHAGDLDAVRRAVAGASPSGHWLLKRAFGFAGRGRLRVHAGALDAHALRWIEAALAKGDGLGVEPWVERAGDFALHGFVDRDRALWLGTPTQQICDGRGAWVGTSTCPPGALARAESEALARAAEEAAEALARAGYFGPFGVDAFRWRDPAGGLRFNPRCEINARYSMGWATGMGASRPDREA